MTSAAVCRQEQVNRAVYYAPGVYRYYLHTALNATERAAIDACRTHIEGCDVLDVGVGAGRTAPHLAAMARRYEGIDYSPVMVEYARRALPGIAVREADFRDLSMYADDTFDFIFATDNVIDALSPDDRLRALRESFRVLRAGGVLAFSSHNLRYRRALSAPWLDWTWNPLQMAKNTVRYAQSWWNYRRVGPLRQVAEDHALLNDRGHFYACLHYYAPRATVQRQLESCGFRLRMALADGRVVEEGADDSAFASLLYVAEAVR